MNILNSIDQVESLIKDFSKALKSILKNKDFDIPTFKKPINAARFPDEINEKLVTDRQGIYIYWAKDKLDKYIILYVGKSKDITNRFYSHKGTHFSWDRPGSKAYFPNNFTNKNPWVSQDIKNIISNAQFYVSAIICNDSAIAHLIESFLIFALDPKINIAGKRKDSFIRYDS